MSLIIYILLPICGVALFIIYRKLKKKFKPSEKWKISISTQLKNSYNKSHTKNMDILKEVMSEMEDLLNQTLSKRKIKGDTLEEKIRKSKKYFDNAMIEDLTKSYIEVKQKNDNLTTEEFKIYINHFKEGVELLLKEK